MHIKSITWIGKQTIDTEMVTTETRAIQVNHVKDVVFFTDNGNLVIKINDKDNTVVADGKFCIEYDNATYIFEKVNTNEFKIMGHVSRNYSADEMISILSGFDKPNELHLTEINP